MWETSAYGPLGWGAGVVSALVVLPLARTAVRRAASRPPRALIALCGPLVRPRPRTAVRMHRAALAVRRRHGASALPERRERAAQRDALVEAERAARVLRAARAAWLGAVLTLLPAAATLLTVWAVRMAWVPVDVFPAEGAEHVTPLPDAAVSAVALGAAVGLVAAGVVAVVGDVRRVTVRRPRPPLLPAAAALIAVEDGLHTPPLRLGRAVGALCEALETYAAYGDHAPHDRRREDLISSARAVGRALYAAEGAVWRDPDHALPRLVLLLATVNDRAHKGRWLDLLDDADLPGPPPDPEPAVSARESGPRSGTWSYVTQQAAILLPAVAAVGALVFSTITVQQANENLRITGHDAISNRLNAAVTNLASRAPNIRLAGLFLLERILQDSPGDRATILPLLCSYVRDHAPADDSSPAPLDQEWGDSVAEDVQEAMDIINRRTEQVDNGVTYDLSGVRLPALNLGGDLQEADFSGAQLPGASFSYADLSTARFTDSDLRAVDFTGTDLAGADLTRADLHNAWLAEADLRGADLSGARLGRAVLSGADLREATLDGADLTDVTYTAATRWPEFYEPPKTAHLVES